MKPLPLFTPVIHVLDDDQAVQQSKVAFSNGADGIFLIDHRRSANALIKSYHRVRQVHPSGWIGLNFLDLKPHAAVMKVPDDADGLWFDNPVGLTSFDLNVIHQHTRTFAGVAFKYQVQPGSAAQAAEEASRIFNVVTTSGSATGIAASREKIKNMKEAMGPAPLALASGVSIENCEQYQPFVRCFMVSTSISRSFHELDPEKTMQLSMALNSMGWILLPENVHMLQDKVGG